MRIRALWTLFGVTGGFFVGTTVAGLVSSAGIAIMALAPPSAGWWLVGLGFALALLVVLGAWITFVWLCIRWGKAAEVRAAAHPENRMTTERNLLWLGTVISAAYLGIIGLYAGAHFWSPKQVMHYPTHQVVPDSTRTSR